MRVWLDDLRQMPEGFDRHVRTAEEAIALLSTKKVTHISFDHDLGEKQSGYDVATWIEQQAFTMNLPRLTWQVHSMNPVGADRIRMAMESADRSWGRLDGLPGGKRSRRKK